MNIRIELLGHVLYLELGKAEQVAEPEAVRPPDTAPQPMVVYEGQPTEPLGFHSGGLERG